MAKHYKTPDPPPADLVEKLVKRYFCVLSCVLCPFLTNFGSRYVNVGMFYLRQVAFAKYDIQIHTDKGNECI